MMKSTILSCLFAMLSPALLLHAQDAKLVDPCRAMPKAGTPDAKYFLTFDRFDKELRAAISNQDALALVFLVKFPLEVNDAGGTISIDDAAALKTHFQEVFTPAVRKEILSEKNDNVSCNVEGIGYARGVIWVKANNQGYAIWSVNRDYVPPYPANYWNTPKTRYICQTQTHRIVVDTISGGALRYRSWNKPRPLTGKPDLEISKGDGTWEGTNLCAVPIFTFKSATATFRVEGGLGCDPDTPSDSTGRLEVTIGDKPATGTWCY